ncbi:MAG: hypothetical protein EXX96DRAFT_540326 [Benjaminiella poitrasii]|nr:MAG: hypothetical protein EXX96DRAFT_540326 [Benjaminiella poitrasii]
MKNTNTNNNINNNNRTCRHVTIKQVKDAAILNGDQFMIDQRETTHICLMGVIRAVIKSETYIMFSIEDGTGMMDARYWCSLQSIIDDEGDTQDHNVPLFKHDNYVKLFGRLQNFNQQTTCIVVHIELIQDFNEITFHFLNAIYTHIIFTNHKKLPTAVNSIEPSKHDTPANTAVPDNDTNEIVKRAIQICGNTDMGCHIQALIYYLKELYTESKVMQSIEGLSNEGEIYSTSDGFLKLVNV